jgi:hypothetical protein
VTTWFQAFAFKCNLYRYSVAEGAGDAAGARRVEQGLRRLAAALDKTSPAHHCTTLELLELLVTYVQVATMLARWGAVQVENAVAP